jgi:hypothetical protein
MCRPAGIVFAIVVILALSACGELVPVPVSEEPGTPGTPTTNSKDEAQPEAGSETPSTQPAIQTTPTELAIAFSGEPPSGNRSLEVMQTRIAEQEKGEGGGPQPTPTPRPRVVVTSPETVSAPALGLMWQSRAAGMFRYDDAELYCRNLTSGDHPDWRLPSIAELQWVVGSGHQAASLSQAEMLWSSTPHDVRGVLVLDLRAGKESHLTAEMAHVICVRNLR